MIANLTAKVLLTSAGIVIYVSQEGGVTAEETRVTEELERQVRRISGSLGKLTEASLVPEMRSPAALWQCFVRVDQHRREEIIELLRASLVGVEVGHL